ncbi:S8 family serine peptidase [Thalassotalea litorea]|uniref:S8 family serine peptidase n=1 Tax=Thalassotalea litorea TaxID=2020715 RepID=UPI0037369C13
MKKTLISSAVIAVLSSAAHAEAPTYGGSASQGVENQCIVQFNDAVAKQNVHGLAHGLAKRAGSSVKHVYKHSIKGMTINMPCHAAQKAFANDANVTRFTPDGVVSANRGKPNPNPDPDPQVLPWSVTRVGGPVDGSSYTAWVIDSGIDLDHPDLNIDADRGFTAIKDGKNYSMDDLDGHGTHVAGTIAAIDNDIGVVGVAAGATVVPVRVLDRKGFGSWSGIIAGVDHVAENAAPGDCANMSLGGGVNQAVDDAVVAAASNGIIFAIAAGNDGQHADNSTPARANGENVYTISATQSDDSLVSWSNFGNPPVDYAAPGVSILSLYKDGGTATMSGTSMASPAACAVLMLSNGNPSTDGVAGNDPDGTPDPIITL